MKIGTAHQPNYIPWIGFFSKIEHSNCFVIADTFLLGDQSVFNRNKIRTKDGWGYISIPISHKSLGTKICDITLPEDTTWKNKHWQTIYRNYVKTEYFKEHIDFFEALYKRDFDYVWQINVEIIKYLINCFHIEVELLTASKMNLDKKLRTTDFIIAMMKASGSDVYLSGPSGRDYLETNKFAQNNLVLKFFRFEHPIYKQRYPGFESNMSALDLLFNMGPEASEIIKTSGSNVD